MFTSSSIFKECAPAFCARLFLPLLPILLTITTQAEAADGGQSGNAFNPSIGLILNGTYGEFSNDPDEYTVSGFPLGEESDPGTRGFSIGESELNFSANIDPNWYGALTIAMAGEEAEVENAYVQTDSLGNGLTLKAGRFFSGIGYLNEHHAHTWDFVDTTLPYRALLGTQFGDEGVQLRWLAPLPLFTELGVEWFRGDAFPAGGSANKGRGSWASYIHVGGDINDSQSWRAGLSYLATKADERESGDEDDPDLFTGSSDVTIVDMVWKWAPNGNPYQQNLTLQAEYLRSNNDGDFTPAGANPAPYEATPSGWYAQAVYQFMPRWRLGLRHDEMRADAPGSAFQGTVLDDQGHKPKRDSLMIDFAGSEFSRLRLQFNNDQSGRQTDKQVFVQYIMSLGAHGAHIF